MREEWRRSRRGKKRSAGEERRGKATKKNWKK